MFLIQLFRRIIFKLCSLEFYGSTRVFQEALKWNKKESSFRETKQLAVYKKGTQHKISFLKWFCCFKKMSGNHFFRIRRSSQAKQNALVSISEVGCEVQRHMPSCSISLVPTSPQESSSVSFVSSSDILGARDLEPYSGSRKYANGLGGSMCHPTSIRRKAWVLRNVLTLSE